MKLKDVLKILQEKRISFVLIGGVALNLYGSDRVTFDSDIAIKTVDIDQVIEILASGGLAMVIGVDEDRYPELTRDLKAAREFSENSKWGFLKFLGDGLELDVTYDIPVPFMHLYNESVVVKIGDIDVHVASVEHIKIMKEKAMEYRDDEKRYIDELDLRFIAKKLDAGK